MSTATESPLEKCLRRIASHNDEPVLTSTGPAMRRLIKLGPLAGSYTLDPLTERTYQALLRRGVVFRRLL